MDENSHMMEMEQEDTAQDGIDERSMRLMALAESKLALRDEAISFRAASGIEREWREAKKLYDGEDADTRHSMLDYATGEASRRQTNEQPRSRVAPNVTRCRTDTAVGRFVDIITPTDRAPWDMEPTPVPVLAEMILDRRKAAQDGPDGRPKPITFDDGRPATVSDVAQDIKAKAKKAMEGMADVIKDQTAECDFVHECRKAVHKSAMLGTGILKGPVVGKDIKRSYQQAEGGFQLAITEDFTPHSKSVDPWCVYPSADCGDDIRKASYVWERDTILPREVRNLIGVPGYLEDQLRLVLEEEPKRTTAVEDGDKWKIAQNSITKGSSYEIWEYHGEVSSEDMKELGCGCEAEYGSVSACVVFINDRPVRVDLNVLDTGDLPYDFFPWMVVDGRPWGRGIPYEMHHLQRIITAAWRAMMDNARDSAGANLIIGHDLEPITGWTLTGKNIWRPTSKDVDVRTLFNQFQLLNNQGDYQAIIELALRFIDLVTGIPTIFTGEQQKMPETLGQTNIVVDSANIGVRMRVKIFDDMITRPHIRRYYDYNMQYHPDPKIKGDYKVMPIALSVLYERDQAAQRLAATFALKQIPEIDRITDWEAAGKQYYQMNRLDILKSPEALAAYDERMKQAKGPGNPQAEVAQIRVSGDLEKAKMNQQADMAEINAKGQEANLDRQHEMQLKVLEREMLMLKLASEQNISLESIKAALAGKTMELGVQKELAAASNQAKQVAEANMEPVGQAPKGEAFQK